MPPTSMNRKGKLGEHAMPLALAAVLLWLVAALAVRSLPWVFESKWRTLAACLAMVPLAEALLIITGNVLGFERTKRLSAAAWLGSWIIGCHVLAIVLWPALYGNDEATIRHGSAWLAWAAVCPIINARIAAERG